MKLSKKYQIGKFQEGGAPMPVDPAAAGAAPAPEAAPAPDQGGDPLQQLLDGAMQAVQGQDCQTAMAVCQGLVQLAQGAGAQGGAPAPSETAPVVSRKRGGILRMPK